MRLIRVAAIDGAIVGNIPGRPTTHEPPSNSVASNLERFHRSIMEVSAFGVDIACLPEAFARIGTPDNIAEIAEPVPGPTTDHLAQVARANRIAVVCPLYERRAGGIYNTAVVIDRDGQTRGRYDKVHLTGDELRAGVRSGPRSAPLLDFDGIRIGIQLCFDANWADAWVDMKKQGMQLAFFASEFAGGRLIESFAVALAVPIVVATACRESRVYDRLGRIVAHQTPYYGYAIADLLIDQPLFHLDGQWDKVDAIRRGHPEVSIEVLGGEGRWTMVGDPALLEALMARYGLLDVDDYLKLAVLEGEGAGP